MREEGPGPKQTHGEVSHGWISATAAVHIRPDPVQAHSHSGWQDSPCGRTRQSCVPVADFWDTAGQERFQSMHASYYHKAHACIMVFDVQRKVTYKNLSTWYTELREFRPEIPCIVVANKIDADVKMTQKSFNFARKFSLPLYFVSAADGTNVVKLFNDAIRLAVSYKHNSQDFMDEVLQELENFDLEQKEEEVPDQAQRGNTESPSPS
ncbi:rab-like protein 2B isoform X4 [Meles meles]|uniref:rab-like protein 2B isoform X4 n=1 Tax=Meles meles TaxID=9662 RepID=UPI001E6990D8|nr:rab-like protein 2B isoform X4 [Meles meles]